MAAKTASPSGLISSSEVAYLFRSTFGPIFEWSNFLTDMRRGRHDKFHLPVTKRIHGRPYYGTNDLLTFMAEFEKAYPESRQGVPIVIIDPATLSPTKFRRTRITSELWAPTLPALARATALRKALAH